MRILRTPEERFAELSDYPFEPRYLLIQDRRDEVELRMHYVDEGDPEAKPVLMLHGEPTWSFLYRKMIPLFVDAGQRALAPDLIGFGKSDKPGAREDYSYARHVEWMQDWLAALDLRDITLVCQDWGGLIGLRLVAAEPARFARVITANTFLPTGDEPAGEAFEQWRRFSQRVPEFSAGHIVDTATVSTLSESVKAAYDAPFPSEEYKAGARQFPMLVPTRPDDPESQANRDAWESLRHFDRPWLCAFGDSDPITASGAETFRKLVPGCVGQPHKTIAGAGHFIQEDKGEELARMVLAFMERG